jgi:hypothetical protein
MFGTKHYRKQAVNSSGGKAVPKQECRKKISFGRQEKYRYPASMWKEESGNSEVLAAQQYVQYLE